MNSTNRALNRIFIAIVGLVLLAAGAVALALAFLPGVRDQWSASARQLARDAPDWIGTPTTGQASLLTLAVVVAAAVLIVLLLVFVLRQGHGRTAAAIERSNGASVTRIDLSIPRTLLEEHLGKREDIVALRVSAYEVRGTPMIKITARCRRGTSPAWMADTIARAVSDLESIVGADIPTFIQLTGGFRVQVTRAARFT